MGFQGPPKRERQTNNPPLTPPVAGNAILRVRQKSKGVYIRRMIPRSGMRLIPGQSIFDRNNKHVS